MKQRIAALSLCVALVTACGTNAPDTEPTPSPTVHEVDPIAGLPGTQVTLEGSGLGGSGVLLLGDLEVAATAWSAESVTFRSEERRVGKECRCRGAEQHDED